MLTVQSLLELAMTRKVLIVDDSPIIRRLVRSSIEDHDDWTICGEAENGKIAVDMVANLRPDLVILDLSMPVMNGLDAAREMSTIAPGITIIMLTMHESETIREEAQRAGIRCVISKADGFWDDAWEAITKIVSGLAA